MGADETRWPSATVISIALHGLLVLGAQFSSSRSGSVVILLPDDPRASASIGPRFEPGALVPIELAFAEPEQRSADMLDDERGVHGPGEASREERPSAEVRGSTRFVAKEAEPESVHVALAEPGEPQHGEDLAQGGREHLGLLGSGREARGFDPGLLRGSRALYDESASVGVREGPRPRQASAPPSKDYGFEREGDEWVYRHPNGSFVATLRADGGVDFRDRVVAVEVGSTPALARDGEEFVTLEIEHDPVGIARAMAGLDPYPRPKAELLAATFEMRLEVATRYHKQRLIDELARLDDELDDIWNASGPSLAERKRLLFERWDGCEEPEGGELAGFPDADSSALDEARRKLASAARRKIIRFIAKVAPAGSPEAYTEAELVAFNERRVSVQLFAPYD